MNIKIKNYYFKSSKTPRVSFIEDSIRKDGKEPLRWAITAANGCEFTVEAVIMDT